MLKPPEYPSGSYFYQNEKPISWWIDLTDKLYEENKDIFIIIYGGEPFMRDDLSDLVIHMNKIKVNYTIISNCVDQKKIEVFFSKVGRVRGFTASIDPILHDEKLDKDPEFIKSKCGFDTLIKLKDKKLVDDLVAEITCDNESIYNVEHLIKFLSDHGIYSDLTVIDISKNQYYDFSDVTNEKFAVEQSEEVKNIFDRLINSDYKIHMKKELLPLIYDNLPTNFKCNLGPENMDNITIDSDGKLRLCLRIAGRNIRSLSAFDLFEPETRNHVARVLEGDRETICNGCIWTCAMMGELGNKLILNHE